MGQSSELATQQALLALDQRVTDIEQNPGNPSTPGGPSARYVESTLARTAGPTDPLALTWALKAKRRDLVLLDDRFVEEGEDFLADTGLYTRLTATPTSDAVGDYNNGTITLGGGKLVLTGAGNGTQFRLMGTRTLRAPYAAVIVQVSTWSGATENNIARAGLYADANNYLELSVDKAAGSYSVVLKLDAAHSGGPARSQTVLNGALTVTGAMRFALRLDGASVSVWAHTGDGWAPLAVTGTGGLWNPFDEAVITQFRFGLGGFQPAGSALTLGGWRAGTPGPVGYRVPIIVTWDDGVPYRAPDGRLYVTLVNAGLPATPTDAADAGHTGIYLLDLSTFQLEEVGKHFYRFGGGVAGYQGTQIVVMRDTGEMVTLVTTYGGPAQKVALRNIVGRTRADVLHGVHVLSMTAIPLPNGALTYDGWLDLDFDGTHWWLGTGVVVTPGNVQAALFRSNSADLLGGWTLVNQDTSTGFVVEACKCKSVNGIKYWVFASTNGVRVYTHDTLTYLGNDTWDSTAFAGSPPTPPHAMDTAIARSDGMTTYLRLSSANVPLAGIGGFESEGTLIVLTANERPTGWEHPYRTPVGVAPGAARTIPPLAPLAAPASTGAGGGSGGALNLLAGRAYTLSPAPASSYPDSGGELTNGAIPSTSFGDPGWVGWQNANPSITADFGATIKLVSVEVVVLQDGTDGIVSPDLLVEISADGSTWTAWGSNANLPTPSGATVITAAVAGAVGATCRYLRVTATRHGEFAFLGEIRAFGSAA